MAATGSAQPMPQIPFELLDEYDNVIFGWTFFLPGGTTIGILRVAAPVAKSVLNDSPISEENAPSIAEGDTGGGGGSEAIATLAHREKSNGITTNMITNLSLFVRLSILFMVKYLTITAAVLLVLLSDTLLYF